MGALQKRKGPSLLVSALLPVGLWSTVGLARPAPSSPSRKQMGKALGGRGSWPPWPQLLGCCSGLFFPVADAHGSKQEWSHGGLAAWLPCARPWGVGGVPELWPSSPPRPLPTPWDAGLGSWQVSSRQ